MEAVGAAKTETIRKVSGLSPHPTQMKAQLPYPGLNAVTAPPFPLCPSFLPLIHSASATRSSFFKPRTLVLPGPFLKGPGKSLKLRFPLPQLPNFSYLALRITLKPLLHFTGT